jgi:cytochrome c2
VRSYLIPVAASLLFLSATPLWPQQESPADLFAHKCAQCHSIGGGRMVGPDLKGVTQTRSRAWLMKFIQDPEAMMQSGDKDALALRDQYSGITMPQMNVTPAETRQLIQYISQKSKSASGQH